MASVTFKRGTREEIEATAKQDGQILMETDQNKKNKMYIDLPDGSRVLIGNSGEAIDTSYDNTTSGLDATNVQNAIDKIKGQIDTLNSKLVKVGTFTGTTSSNGNVILTINANKYKVLGGVITNIGSYIALHYVASNRKGYYFHCVSDGDMKKLSNTQVTIEYEYIEI